MKQIAVLISCSKHPASGVPRHHHNDSLALQLGLNLANKHAATLQALHAGNADNTALQDYLALGASQIDVISAAGSIVENLAAQLQNVDLILTGTRAENGEDSGLLPYLLAAKLNLPVVAGALEIYINKMQDKVEVLQFLPKGQRRRVAITLPAVVAVHPLAPIELHFVHTQRSMGKINNISNQLSDFKANTTAKWIAEPTRKAIKLKARAEQTGHQRLMAAIGSQSKAGTVVNDGNNVEKAQVILRYLREYQLIEF